ncbi:MAG TPA: hypothetical protein VF103_04650 [Polyangiaceae bacterium]
MPVDGIGKPPGVPPPGGAPATSGAGATRETFRTGAAAAPEVSTGDLARLERGEIGLDAYLDARVGEATKHLEGRLGRAELEFVRRTLRAELESDPVLVELVRRATGQTPGAAEA